MSVTVRLEPQFKNEQTDKHIDTTPARNSNFFSSSGLFSIYHSFVQEIIFKLLRQSFQLYLKHLPTFQLRSSHIC